MRNPVIYFVLLIALLNSCNNRELNRIHFQGKAQGTYYSIIYFDALQRNFQQQIDSLLDDYNMSVSIYEHQSVISQINRNEEALPDQHFVDNLLIATKVAKETDGAFDFTVGQLVNAWGFGPEERKNMRETLLDSLLESVGYTKVRIENNRIIKDNPDTKIDFNAVAKGYAVDLCAKFLESRGISRYLVDIGGEVYASGRKENNMPWSVGVEMPVDDTNPKSREVKAVVDLENMSIATSGNYRKFYIEDGMKYSHTINPKTGKPVTHKLLSASVFSPQTAYSDAYATAFMVMGLDNTIEFVSRKPELGVFLIYADDDGKLQTFISENIKILISKEY